MKIQSFASGSGGNCTYIEGKRAKILIDAGISYRRILTNLEKLSLTPEDLDAILITHTHVDHVSGIKVFVKHAPTKFYLQEGMYKALKDVLPLEQVEFYQKELVIKGLHIKAFPTSHDVSPSCGFLIEEEEKSLVYVTDTGYLKEKELANLSNKNLYFIEANHDEELLMNGSYRYPVKQRILGDKGHLSNHLTARYLKQMVGKDTKQIVLAHLSQDNNRESLALETIEKQLSETPFSLSISVARQDETTELIEV